MKTQWTKEKPRRPGWYLTRRRPSGEPECVYFAPYQKKVNSFQRIGTAAIYKLSKIEDVPETSEWIYLGNLAQFDG